MDNWLDTSAIEKAILKCIKQNTNESEYKKAKQTFFYNHRSILYQMIEEYRDYGLKISQKNLDLIKIMNTLLTIEAKVISIIDTAIYCSTCGHTEMISYFEQDTSLIYKDYLELVSYYANDFYEFSFLASFYKNKVC